MSSEDRIQYVSLRSLSRAVICVALLETSRTPRLKMVLVLGTLTFVLVGCNFVPPLPYYAKVLDIEPQISGLTIHATKGFGGEVEIINETERTFVLLDESNHPYARISPKGVYEWRNSVWHKVNDGNHYYMHDPRLRYLGPPPTDESSTVMKEWIITGLLDEEKVKIQGVTVYSP